MKHIEPNNQIVLIDLDDVLIKTHRIYIYALQKILDLLMNFNTKGIDLHATYIEQNNLRKAMHCGTADYYAFYNVLKDVYRQSCTQANDVVFIYMKSLCTRFIYETIPELYPDVKETLTMLIDSGYKLVCYTLGDENIQTNRLEQTGLLPMFDEVVVVRYKSAQILQETCIMFNVHPANTYSIGNSPLLDIRQGVEAGCNTILVRDDFSDYELIKDLTGKFSDVSTFKDILCLIPHSPLSPL